MKQIVTCKEMKALDGNMIEGIGIPSCVLMERAALKVAEELERTLADKKQEERILCVCGSGNNGGDGVAVARILKLHGYRTSLYLVGNPDHRTVEMQRQLDIAAACQVPVVNNLETEEYTTIVDAIFGVGLSRPVEGSYRDVIMALNQLNAWKVAVDIPSGVNGDTGAELGIAFHADLTVTFAFRKAGLCLYPGRKFAGKVIVADVGIYTSDKVKPYLWQTEKTDISGLERNVWIWNWKQRNFWKDSGRCRKSGHVWGGLPQCVGSFCSGQRNGENRYGRRESDSTADNAAGSNA